MLNRTQQPPIRPISSISFPSIKKIQLGNGLPVHLIQDDAQEVVRLDFMFACGSWYQSQVLVSNFTNEMLREGTNTLNSKDIAEKLDFYGSWLQLSASYHYSYLTVYSLCKYLPETLEVIESMLKESVFPQAEFEVLLNKRKQQWRIEQQKVQNLANRRFSACIYGETHPYGRSADETDFDRLNTQLLKDFYAQYYHAGNCQLVLSGKISDTVLSVLEKKFGGKDWRKEKSSNELDFTPTPLTEKHHRINKADTVQAAVRIGRTGITRQHPDYNGLKVLVTALGGYFGSRLMSSIREKKGYTYGIGASLSSMQKGGSLSISTQTANEYVTPLIKEVYVEMEKLRNQPIGEEEIGMVKNYLLGEMARAFDSTFSITDGYISLLANDLTPTFFKEQLDTIHQISAQELQNLAKKYLKKEDFYEVVAG